MSLHSGGSWWFLFGLVTGGASGGPPACVVGAVGAGPCGLFTFNPEGWPWALLSLLCLGPFRMVFSLMPSLDDNCCWGCVAKLSALGGMNLPWTCLFVMDSFRLYEAFPLGSWWALIEVCCFIMYLV